MGESAPSIGMRISEKDPGLQKVDAPLILIVDDDDGFCRSLARLLHMKGLKTQISHRASEALALIEENEKIRVVFCDVYMDEMNGIELCRKIIERRPSASVLIMTAMADVETAVLAMQAGAKEFLVKPFPHPDTPFLAVQRTLEMQRLHQTNEQLLAEIRKHEAYEDIITSDPKMVNLFRLIDGAAPSDATFLIQGESGVGKELFARAIHRKSSRSGQPLISINCAAFTESLLESELFGHTKGAFTGAHQTRMGIFQKANYGTIFLDEIGEVSPPMQAKLLRTLQEGEIRPVGSNEIRHVDVRFIAATNRDLESEVKAGRFREDLFYRINVIMLSIPPLRERRSDIPLLIRSFLPEANRIAKKTIERISPDALAALQNYDWPGNVRQLKNILERAVVLSDGISIRVSDLPQEISSKVATSRFESEEMQSDESVEASFSEAREKALRHFEITYTNRILLESHGNIATAARRAKMDPSNLRRMMKKLGIQASDFKMRGKKNA